MKNANKYEKMPTIVGIVIFISRISCSDKLCMKKKYNLKAWVLLNLNDRQQLITFRYQGEDTWLPKECPAKTDQTVQVIVRFITKTRLFKYIEI